MTARAFERGPSFAVAVAGGDIFGEKKVSSVSIVKGSRRPGHNSLILKDRQRVKGLVENCVTHRTKA